MQRIGMFGGTYNPPHLGHIQAAIQGAEALNVDRMLLIPTRQPPHKQTKGGVSPQQRMAMLRLAVQDSPVLEACGIELERPGPSYSVDTVRALKAQYPDSELVLFMGTDMFTSFLTWKDPQVILENVTLAVFYRGDKGEEKTVKAQMEALTAMGAKIQLVKNEVIPISSTQLRRLLAFQCAGGLVSPAVEAYIRENGLYDTQAEWRNLPMEQLEEVVVSLLNPNRVAHVLGCRDTAVELAKRWGADVTDAARAGILHDITKALDGPLQLTLCEGYGKILSDFSRKYPRTLHSLTGSMVADRIFGENEAVVEAIKHHTTGKANMNLLEKIIYVADYMEPNRDFPGVEKLRELAFADITAALKLGLEMTLEHLNRQGNEVSKESREALDWLACKI